MIAVKPRHKARREKPHTVGAARRRSEAAALEEQKDSPAARGRRFSAVDAKALAVKLEKQKATESKKVEDREAARTRRMAARAKAEGAQRSAAIGYDLSKKVEEAAVLQRKVEIEQRGVATQLYSTWMQDACCFTVSVLLRLT